MHGGADQSAEMACTCQQSEGRYQHGQAPVEFEMLGRESKMQMRRWENSSEVKSKVLHICRERDGEKNIFLRTSRK